MREENGMAPVFGQFAKGGSKPLMATIEVTNRCNMDYPVCFFDANHHLDEVTKEFLNSAKHVVVDTEKQVVRLSKTLRFYFEDFVNARIAPSLIGYVNQYRDITIPETFRIEFIPFDWTINSQ